MADSGSMLRAILPAIATVAVAYLGLCAGLFLFQRYLIYLPQPGSDGGAAGTIALSSAGATLRVSVRPRAGPNALVYFGGNAEDVSLNLPTFAARLHDHAIYLLHYRGYGGSSGHPSEDAIARDALALFDLVRETHRHIVVVGRSLGSGPAVRVASLRPASRLVLITPFDSLADLAARQFPFLPVRWLLRDKYESWRYAPRVSAPTLILAAEHDEVVPRSSTELLYTRFAKGVASLEVLAGTSHNTISESPRYLPLIHGGP